MTWEFNVKNVNPLFNIAVVDVAPGDFHHFETDGRREYIDESNELVRRDNAMMITHGTLRITVENQNPVNYIFDNFFWDEETGLMGNTNPFPYERQVYPTGNWMDLVGGPEGTQWVCFLPQIDHKLSYDVYKGPHTHACLDSTTYGVLIDGTARFAGADRELYDVVELGASAVNTVEASSDAIVVYLWERH